MSWIIVVKIGTESLQEFHYSEKIDNLVQWIVDLTRWGEHILLVTSGAVKFGRQALGIEKTVGEHKPMLAAVWWHRLMQAYEKKFMDYSTYVAWILLTHADIEDFEERGKFLLDTIHSMWKSEIVPIINENDALCIEEIDALKRGWDNDKNALLLATLLGARQLILVTNTNGVYKKKEDPTSRIEIMYHWELTEDYMVQLCWSEKSYVGTGGMRSKLEVAYEAGKWGISTHIWDGIHSWIQSISSWWTNILAVS